MPVPGPRSVLCASPAAVAGSDADTTPPPPLLVMSREQPVPAKPRIGRKHTASNSTLFPPPVPGLRHERHRRRTSVGAELSTGQAAIDFRWASLNTGIFRLLREFRRPEQPSPRELPPPSRFGEGPAG